MSKNLKLNTEKVYDVIMMSFLNQTLENSLFFTDSRVLHKGIFAQTKFDFVQIKGSEIRGGGGRILPLAYLSFLYPGLGKVEGEVSGKARMHNILGLFLFLSCFARVSEKLSRGLGG